MFQRVATSLRGKNVNFPGSANSMRRPTVMRASSLFSSSASGAPTGVNAGSPQIFSCAVAGSASPRFNSDGYLRMVSCVNRRWQAESHIRRWQFFDQAKSSQCRAQVSWLNVRDHALEKNVYA